MKPRIYVDTSVIGGCFDKEFESPSLRLIESFKTGEAIIVVSDLTLLELELAPVEVGGVLENIPDGNKECIELREEARELARCYYRRCHRPGKNCGCTAYSDGNSNN